MGTGYAIVDLFAGPGGLAEGLSAVEGNDGSHPFKIALSIEKERAAHSTLLLRSFLRHFGDRYPARYYRFLQRGGPEPDWSDLFPNEWQLAASEALNLKIGDAGADQEIDQRLDEIHEANHGNVILVGGPPCQAYSLVGRARNRGNRSYVPEEDHRHFLYREYIRILGRLRPAAFVMENVKGILSSTVEGEAVFEKVLQDLARPAPDQDYVLIALARHRTESLLFEDRPHARDFVIQAEDFGIPQARHRVFVVGLRSDLARNLPVDALGMIDEKRAITTVRQAIGSMPALRSRLSGGEDNERAWKDTVASAMEQVARISLPTDEATARRFTRRAKTYRDLLKQNGSSGDKGGEARLDGSALELHAWLRDPKVPIPPNHETRSHMASDLVRYFFVALYGEVVGRSPSATDFPPQLAPNHANWASGKFADRFRVQLWEGPSTTVTSHISKDGHYFVHPDPLQCRSLTVREAARLQTFPDNYYFKGNRTEQYTQVGNAVPPLLARRIGQALLKILTVEKKSRQGVMRRVA